MVGLAPSARPCPPARLCSALASMSLLGAHIPGGQSIAVDKACFPPQWMTAATGSAASGGSGAGSREARRVGHAGQALIGGLATGCMVLGTRVATVILQQLLLRGRYAQLASRTERGETDNR